jgi:hypothetical protein
MPDPFYYFAIVVLYAIICYTPPSIQVKVYSGDPFQNSISAYSTIHPNGTVNVWLPRDDNYCYQNVETWCEAMIETIGRPLYLMTDTYYGENGLVPQIKACQERMMYGVPFDQVLSGNV